MNVSSLLSTVAPAPMSPTSQISTGGTETSGGNFGTLVKDAVESIEGSQRSADQEIAKAVTGESPDLHRTIIALQTADLKFQLGLQVRNKLIGAYEEIMRMQV
ncbi:MAG: flagellar hook-basal body complex protein FliE [Pyrinomonadaceae bacterium]|nr:flagellar hook-basal body complex protein FliE [Pyrinomonadaceae bacterium]